MFIKDEVNCITELLKSPTYLYSAQKSLVMLFWLIIHAVLITTIGIVHYVVGKPAPLRQDTTCMDCAFMDRETQLNVWVRPPKKCTKTPETESGCSSTESGSITWCPTLVLFPKLGPSHVRLMKSSYFMNSQP